MRRLLIFWFFSATAGFVAVTLTVLLIAIAFTVSHRDSVQSSAPQATAANVSER